MTVVTPQAQMHEYSADSLCYAPMCLLPLHSNYLEVRLGQLLTCMTHFRHASSHNHTNCSPSSIGDGTVHALHMAETLY